MRADKRWAAQRIADYRYYKEVSSSVANATSPPWGLIYFLAVGLCEYEVLGDGNCQFRSLSDQLFRTPKHYRQVRKAIVKELRSHPSRYKPYVPDDYRQYCNNIAKDTTWGDNITLQASRVFYCSEAPPPLQIHCPTRCDRGSPVVVMVFAPPRGWLSENSPDCLRLNRRLPTCMVFASY